MMFNGRRVTEARRSSTRRVSDLRGQEIGTERARRQNALSRLKQIAKERGGRCLSEIYTTAKDLYRFRCREGHEWHAAANNITRANGTWCQKCAGRDRAEAHFARVQERIRRDHPLALLLSKTYVNKDTALRVQCERGHLWNGNPQVILRGGWCKRCAAKKNAAAQRCTFADFQRLVISKRGELLTGEDDFAGNSTRVRIRCEEGHEWSVTVASIRQQDSWCPWCAGVIVSLPQVKQKAIENGGRLLDVTYTNAQTPMRFECARGHEFRLPWNKVQSGRWCPKCSGYLGEELCRYFLEKAFRVEFHKQKPAWLIDASGRRLELDGYNEKLGVAFEHHGDQKFRAGTRFAPTGSEVAALKRRMREKARICDRNGVALIEVRQVGTVVPVDDLPRVIIDQLREKGVIVPRNASRIRVSMADVHRRGVRELDRYRAMVKAKGGELLSKVYSGSTVKLDLKCDKGHAWSALPGSISKGHWCAACAGRRKSSIEEMHALAAKRGWTCLSREYRRTNEKLEWRCAEGHMWENSPSKIKAGQGCPTCSGRRITIEDCRELARSLGGECLSTKYVDAHSPLLWRCRNGHEFERSRNRVTNGRWCPGCSIRASAL